MMDVEKPAKSELTLLDESRAQSEALKRILQYQYAIDNRLKGIGRGITILAVLALLPIIFSCLVFLGILIGVPALAGLGSMLGQ